jgi:hypothetical protein
MTGPGASSDEMHGFPFPGRAGRELNESLLDALLNGQSLPPDAPEQACAVAEMLASVAGPAGPCELAGEAAALSAFARSASPADTSPAAGWPTRRRLAWLPAAATGRLAAALLAVATGLGGAAAAYAGALPGPIQNFAHHMIGAPARRPAAPPALTKRHPSARQCAAYEHAKAHGSARAPAKGFAQLAKTPGGAAKIDAYCPAANPDGRPAPAHPGGHPGGAKARGHGNARGHGAGSPPGHGNGHAQANGHAKQKTPGSSNDNSNSGINT